MGKTLLQHIDNTFLCTTYPVYKSFWKLESVHLYQAARRQARYVRQAIAERWTSYC